mgnify:CR=1 FL=1
MRSKYAELLNRLDAMQQAPYYATARETLADAERTIVALETALTELVHAYDSMPDGELGRGLTNGHFLRARPLVVPNAKVTGAEGVRVD